MVELVALCRYLRFRFVASISCVLPQPLFKRLLQGVINTRFRSGNPEPVKKYGGKMVVETVVERWFNENDLRFRRSLACYGRGDRI